MDFDEEQNGETDQPNEDVEMADKVGDREAHEFKPSINGCSVRKLFVGGISWMTTKESLREYFSKFGQVADSVVMYQKISGMPLGFGFVTYADPEIADKVLKEDHTIDGKKVEFSPESTTYCHFSFIYYFSLPWFMFKEYILFVYKVDVKIPVTYRQRIFVGGLPLSLTEGELKEYFSSYGNVVGHQIILDKTTGWIQRFGIVSFDKEEAVEKVLSNGHIHELRGKQVEIKRATSKRNCAQHTSECQIHHGGSGSKSYYGDGGSLEAFGGGYGGNMGSGYGGYGGYEGYGDYGKFAGSYGVSPTGFYPGYGYGFWFGGAMYGAAGYKGSTYGIPAYYGGGSGYGNRGNGSNDGGNGGNGGYGGGGGNGTYVYGNAGAANGRFVPAYYGGGSGYGNSGNGLNDGGNRGYGGGGRNGANAYGNAGADNGRSVPAYYGGGSDDGSRGNGSNDGGNGGYGGGGENGATGADNGRSHPSLK
ncbi:uncharacterized protein LOC125875189 isoform X1 [Solanum stenotomum]|uniref:uncharacterized protein LOC125875189 isoform X1 n=1 Tax=Solanum stenotomum TaxID=172797 RepID=UPI0020D129E7|nr:uncharacterized protein LOC125875189 isoform X1 [Solanum stenotomum]